MRKGIVVALWIREEGGIGAVDLSCRGETAPLAEQRRSHSFPRHCDAFSSCAAARLGDVEERFRIFRKEENIPEKVQIGQETPLNFAVFSIDYHWKILSEATNLTGKA